MSQPKGYEKVNNNNVKMVCKLNKSIYGLKQSGRNWNKTLDKHLKSQGFIQSSHDPCLYLCYDKENKLSMMAIWVDDIMIAATSTSSLTANHVQHHAS